VLRKKRRGKLKSTTKEKESVWRRVKRGGPTDVLDGWEKILDVEEVYLEKRAWPVFTIKGGRKGGDRNEALR